MENNWTPVLALRPDRPKELIFEENPQYTVPVLKTPRMAGKGVLGLNDAIWNRVLEIARFIASSKSTVREAAKTFNVSKSTVHKDMTERLPKVNPQLYEQVRSILEKNKAERHLRGGEATRRKYMSLRIASVPR